MHQLAAIRRSRSIVAVGSASTAELAAMKEFAKNPALQVFEARSVKRFGGGQQAPRNQGDDPEDGPIIRYATSLGRSGSESSTRHAASLEMTSSF